MLKSRRSLKNYLVFPDSQIRYGLLFLAMSGTMHIVLTAITVVVYSRLTSAEDSPPIPMWLIVAFLVGVFFLLQIFAFVLGLVISHRIFGPLVPLTKFVEELKKGEYSQRVQLRSNDDKALQDFASSLNELADMHQKKSS